MARPFAIRTSTIYRYSLFALLLAVLGLFLVWPIVLTVRGGFRDAEGALTLRYILLVFQDPVLVRGLINSFMIAVFTTIGCMLLAMPLAVLAAKYDFRGKALVTSFVLVPLILPPFVGAIGMRALLGRFGSINAFLVDIGLLDPDGPGIDFLGGAMLGGAGRFWGVVIMQVLHLYPILYLNVTAALANLDPTLDEAALNLGAGRWRRFFRITLPLILPGVFAGTTIVFIWAFTELGTPLMFDYYTVTPVQVFWGISEIADNPRPYALVVVMLTVAVGCYLLGKLAFGRRGYAMQSKASVGAATVKLTGWRGWLALSAFVGVTLIAVMPHIGVVLASFTVDGAWYRSVLPKAFTTSHYGEALTHEMAYRSIQNSLMYALAAMVLAIALGLAISYMVVRVKIRGGWVLDALAMLPLAVPGLVMAFGYVAMTLAWPFREGDIFGGFFTVLGQNPNPIALLIIAYAIRRLPYIVRAAAAGLEQTSSELEEASMNLGAGRLYTIRRVVVPLIMANLIAGGILVFSFAMLEVSDSLVLAQQQQHFPITKAIWEFYNRLGDGPYIASAMGVWGMALLTVTLVGASVLMGKRLGAIFRV
ncbi:ABC transporter permease [Phycisphaerales bacterium AB-hyl4]|uniref:ABC transporter permease n=1 Tax=Natronomicrosphaera hydrolytica TaxID=3242702 RepID=A0ABV4UA95_9BACT